MMTVKEAAAQYFAGCSERYVRGLARDRAFGDNVVPIGNKWLVPEDGILEWLQAHRAQVDPASGKLRAPMATPKRLRNLVPFRCESL
jgi:hypothetical protein